MENYILFILILSIIIVIIVFAIIYKIISSANRNKAKHDTLGTLGKASTAEAYTPPFDDFDNSAEMQKISSLIRYTTADKFSADHEIIKSLYERINTHPLLKRVISPYNTNINEFTDIFNNLFPQLKGYSNNGIYLIVEAFLNENSLNYIYQHKYRITENPDINVPTDIQNAVIRQKAYNNIIENNAQNDYLEPELEIDSEMSLDTPLYDPYDEPTTERSSAPSFFKALSSLKLIFMIGTIIFYVAFSIFGDQIEILFRQNTHTPTASPSTPIEKTIFDLSPNSIIKKYNKFAKKDNNKAKPLKKGKVTTSEITKDGEYRSYYKYYKYKNKDNIEITINKSVTAYKDVKHEYIYSMDFAINKKKKKFTSLNSSYQKSFIKMVSSDSLSKDSTNEFIKEFNINKADSMKRTNKGGKITLIDSYSRTNNSKSYKYLMTVIEI